MTSPTTVIAFLLTILALGIGSRSSSTTSESTDSTSSETSVPVSITTSYTKSSNLKSRSSYDTTFWSAPNMTYRSFLNLSVKVSDLEFRSKSAHNTTDKVSNFKSSLLLTSTTPESVHSTGGSKIARPRDLTSKERSKNVNKTKNSRRKQLRMAEFTDDPCLNWSPKLKITVEPHSGLIDVDYCLSANLLSVPATQTCVSKHDFTLCTIVEQPQCHYDFKNLTAGNFTVYINALCRVCFDVFVFNKACVTSTHFKSVVLDSPDQQAQRAVNKIKSSTSEDSVVAVIVAAVASSAIITVVALLVIKKHCYKRPPVIASTSKNRPSLHSSHIELPTYSRGDYYRHTKRQEGSCQRQIQDVTEQETLCLNHESHLRSNTQQELVPSVLTLDSEDDNNENFVGSHRVNNDECVGSHTHIVSKYSEETLENFFSTYTGLRLKSSDTEILPQPIVHIPYHLIYESPREGKVNMAQSMRENMRSFVTDK